MAEASNAEPALIRWISTALKALCVAIAASLLALPLRSGDRVANRPLSEDGYYALTVARNIGLGRGVTIDGEQLTNGFQPLFTLLTVPAFAAFPEDRYMPLRLVLAMHWAVLVLTVYLLALVARDAFAGRSAQERSLHAWLVAFLYLASSRVMAVHFSGLETGFLLMMYALCWRVYQVRGIRTPADATVMGVLLGLTVLSRIDASFLVVVFCLGLLVGHRARPLEGLARAANVGLVALVVSSPWFIYNRICFGSLMPSSGTAQMSFGISSLRLERAVGALTQAALPMVNVGQYEVPALTLGRVLLLLGLAYLVFLWWPEPTAAPRPEDSTQAERAQRTATFGACALATGLALVVWYTLTFEATHFYPRYFAPISLVTVPLLGYVVVEFSKREPTAVLGLVILFGAVSITVTWLLAFGHLAMNSPMYTAQLPLVREHVPEGQVVAAGQSGTLGYFRDNVLNLDGKVNPEALRYQRRMHEYLQTRDVRWLCDWDSYVRAYLGDTPEGRRWRLIAENGFLLYHYESEGAVPPTEANRASRATLPRAR